MNYGPTKFIGKRVGILGGGQLARMLVLEGARLGLNMYVLSPSADDPAAQICRNWVQGDLTNLATVTDFFRRVDIVTLESEFLDQRVIGEAEKASGRLLTPKLDLVSRFSDRASQKEWLLNSGLATADYVTLASGNNGVKSFEKFFAAQKNGVVVKKRRFGYDGFGTYILRRNQDLQKFLAEYGRNLDEFIVEKFVPFKRELAVQFAVNVRGQICEYPLVEWQARDSKCWWVKGPIKSAATVGKVKKLNAKIRRALLKSGFIGIIAFELFESAEGLMINELAPRVHNSAHYSLEALSLSQFAAHLLAIVGLDLPKTATAYSGGFAMLNLIGSGEEAAQLPVPDGISLHWYGKLNNRRGRKMGHLTTLAASGELALKALLKVDKALKL